MALVSDMLPRNIGARGFPRVPDYSTLIIALLGESRMERSCDLGCPLSITSGLGLHLCTQGLYYT